MWILHLDFWKGFVGSIYFFFIAKHCLSRLLEASDNECIGQVMLFPEAISEWMCGNESTPKITRWFLSYAELSSFVRHKNILPYWNETDPVNLKDMIDKFKALETSVRRKYKPSGMGIQKWHLLDNLVDAITMFKEFSSFTGAYTRVPQNVQNTIREKLKTKKTCKEQSYNQI